MSERFKTFGLKKIILGCVLTVPILFCVFGILEGDSLVANLNASRASELVCQTAGSYSQESGYYIGETIGSVDDFLYLSEISMKPGIYRIVVDYNCSSERTNSVWTKVDGASYHALWENPVGLYAGIEQMDFLVWLYEETGQFSVHMDYGGIGDLYIYNIRVYQTNLGSVCVLFLLLLVYGTVLIWNLWKRRKVSSDDVREGKMVVAALLGVTLLASLPLMVDYCLGGADMGFHLLRIEGLMEGIKSGQIPVRIQPRWMCGHGYAVSIFYPDTFLIFPALLRMMGFPVFSAYRFFIIGVNLATAWMAYYSFKKIFGSRYIGLVGCVIYTLAPYRIYNIYSRNAVGEYTAMIFLPLICLGFWLIFKEGRWMVLALGYTGIIQCHVITVELTVVFSVLLCLILWRRFFRKKVFWSVVKAAAFTLLINLWYLVPFADYFLTGDFVFHHTSARTIQERGLLPAHLFYIWNQAGENAHFDETGMVGTVPTTIGAALLLCVILFFWLSLNVSGEQKKDIFYKTAKLTLIISIVALVCTLSIFPWDIIQRCNRFFASLVSNIQFPMRFLVVATICLSVMGCCVAKLILLWRKGREGLLIVGSVMAVAMISCMFYTNDTLFSKPNVMKLYSAENMGDGAILGGEYMPYGAQQSLISYQDMSVGVGVSILEAEKQNLDVHLLCSNEGEESYIDCSMLYYKGYRAQNLTTGEELEVTSGNNGLVRVILPERFCGEVRVWFDGLWYWRAAEVISLLIGVGTMGYLLWKRKNR